MTKSKHAKRALLASVLSLMLCAAMLIGSTFAWFTDSASSGKNQIAAGNLDVELEYMDASGAWKPVDPNASLFLPADTARWEPGHTEYARLRIRNAGSLALKYSFTANVFADEAGALDEKQYTGQNGKFKLSDYLVFSKTAGAAAVTNRESLWIADEAEEKALMGSKAFTNLKMQNDLLLPGGSEEITLAVYMPTWVGNDANQLTSARETEGEPKIYFGLNLFATQTPHEADSFGTKYDEGAELPTIVTSQEELVKAIASAKEGDVIELQNSLELTEPLTLNKAVTLNGNGRTISGGSITATADVKFENIVLSKPTNAKRNATMVYAKSGCKNLTFDGVTFDDPEWEAIQVTSEDLKTLTINNCTFIADDVHVPVAPDYGNREDQAIRYIHYQFGGAEYPVVDFTITNNTFKNCANVIAPIGIFYIGEGSALHVCNNTFDFAEGATQNLIFGWPAMEELKDAAKWEVTELTTYTYAKPVVEPDDPYEEADKKAAEAGNAYRKADGTYGKIKENQENSFLLDNAYRGEEVILIRDIGRTSNSSSSKQDDYSNKNSVLDLNGHTYTFGKLELKQDYNKVAENSSLVIKNGTMQGTINFLDILHSNDAMKTVTLDHVNMKWGNPLAFDAKDPNYYGLKLCTKTNGSVFTVKDCVLGCNASFYTTTYQSDLEERAIANITGTTVNGRLHGAGLTMNVDGCTVNGEVYCNASNSSKTTINISNSEINGRAFFSASSSVKQNDVTIKDTTINGDLQTQTTGDNVHITLENVTVTGTLGYSNSSWKIPTDKVTIVSGTYGFDPTNYLASGSAVTDNGNGTWTVTAG